MASRGATCCPAGAIDPESGPVFRAITRGGRVSGDALADDSVSRIIKKLAGQIGVDPAFCSFASLRAVLIGELRQ